jgi:aspartate carbamoyltransferase catalytic subunit
MPNLLTIDDLTTADITAIIEKAGHYQTHTLAHQQKAKHLANRVVTNLFFETSTRTLNSFSLAESFQDMVVLSPDLSRSALAKGESIKDTLLTMQAMGSALFVIRHENDAWIEGIKPWGLSTAVINAGCGRTAHPTQALIDLCVIQSRFADLSQLKVAIVGDVKHSRVARSQIKLLAKMGVQDIRTVAPDYLQIDDADFSVSQFDNLEQGLKDVEVVIRLRLQKERLDEKLTTNMTAEVQRFCITQQALKVAHNDMILLHPGPCMVGEDIAEGLMDHSQNMILEQVANSVAVRMACIDFALGCL